MSAPLLFATLHALERLPAEAMPAAHRLLLLLLADFADEAGKAWPSKATLAQRAGLAERTVDVALAELAAAGWLEREHRRADASNRNLSSVYTVRGSGEAVSRARSGRHGAPPAPSEGAPAAVGQGAHPAPAAPYGAPPALSGRAGGAGDGAPPAPDPLMERLRSEPPRERAAPPSPAPTARRAKPTEQLKLEPSGPKPEAPIAVLWRVFRVRWGAKYGRKLVSTGQDDAAFAALAKRGAAWCKTEGKADPVDLERLFDWWSRKYLEDRGAIPRPGELGYLERTFHQPKDLERGLAAYGTPWDRAERREAAPAPRGPRAHSSKCTPSRCVCSLGAEVGPAPVATSVERVNVVALFGGGGRR